MTSSSQVPRLRLTQITKQYPGCLANDQIDLSIMPGEIHALLGENGAGKSTLMKIAYGSVRPDAGVVEWDGQPVKIANPAEARALGINMVFQHFSLFETLTVTENIALATDKCQRWDLKQLAHRIQSLSNRYGLQVNPAQPIHTLSVGERQRVEILRCLSQVTRLLILDEPTSVLTASETEQLFTVLHQIAQDGCSILFISHKLKEVQTLCDRATILRNGRVVAHCQPKSETLSSLAQLMVGHSFSRRQTVKSPAIGAVRLAVNNLGLSPQHPFGKSLHHICFEVRSGEILGIAGVAGNGQSELLAALSGEYLCKAQMIQLGNRSVGHLGVAQRRALGLAYAPGDRLGKAAVPRMSLTENALLTGYSQHLVKRGWIRRDRLHQWTQQIIDQFNVKQSGRSSKARSLSGGNLQKFLIGREVLQEPQVFLVAHPTWGVDVRSTASIHEALIQLRNSGTAILLVSDDLDEIFALCDRVAVIHQGILSPTYSVQDCDLNQLSDWMGGVESSVKPKELFYAD
ncbi:ABC transporter ATP-binding protein [Phormidium tenue FACHB-886]|nr:ABC transporter ATP-binding protein [Phormidium tenue FACHB-886]